MLKNNVIEPVSYQVSNNVCFKGLSFKAHNTFGYPLNSSSNTQVINNSSRIVLCLHGWLDNAASFSPLFEQLAKLNSSNDKDSSLENTTFIAIDLIGHGQSTHRSPDAQYHFYDWIYDLLLLLEYNQWDKVDIIGHSMGGMIASTFAAAFPDKTNSLALIDSLGYFTVEAKNTTKQLRKGLMSRLQQLRKSDQKKLNESNKSKREYIHPDLISAINARVSVSDLTFEHAKYIVERGVVESVGGIHWSSDSRLNNISPYRLTQKQSQQLMKDISAPILLIYGNNGHPMVPNGIDYFSTIHRNLQSIELEGGHHIHIEKPAKTAELIKNFLTGIL